MKLNVRKFHKKTVHLAKFHVTALFLLIMFFMPSEAQVWKYSKV